MTYREVRTPLLWPQIPEASASRLELRALRLARHRKARGQRSPSCDCSFAVKQTARLATISFSLKAYQSKKPTRWRHVILVVLRGASEAIVDGPVLSPGAKPS